jgi:hypothetical protein
VEFLETTRPPRAADACAWFDVVIDIARLEHAIDDVFDGAGSEGCAPLDVARLQAIPLDRAGGTRLTLTPSLRLLEFRYPVSDLYSRFRRQQDLDIRPSLGVGSWLALYRRDYVVQRRTLAYDEYVMLSLLASGETLGAAITAGYEHRAGEPKDFFDVLPAYFRDWAAEGLVVGT